MNDGVHAEQDLQRDLMAVEFPAQDYQLFIPL